MKKFADKRICSVSYASKTLNEHFGQTKAGIDNLLKTGKTALAALPVPDALREEIAKDATDIASDIKVFIPEPATSRRSAFLPTAAWKATTTTGPNTPNWTLRSRWTF